MVLGKLPVPGRPTIWITVGQGPTVLAVGAGGSCVDIFTLIYPFSPLSPFLWERARYRLKYCLQGPLNPKQPTNRLDLVSSVTWSWWFSFAQVNQWCCLTPLEPPGVAIRCFCRAHLYWKELFIRFTVCVSSFPSGF